MKDIIITININSKNADIDNINVTSNSKGFTIEDFATYLELAYDKAQDFIQQNKDDNKETNNINF